MEKHIIDNILAISRDAFKFSRPHPSDEMIELTQIPEKRLKFILLHFDASKKTIQRTNKIIFEAKKTNQIK